MDTDAHGSDMSGVVSPFTGGRQVQNAVALTPSFDRYRARSPALPQRSGPAPPGREAEEWVRPAAWAEKKGHAQIAELLRKWQKSP